MWLKIVSSTQNVQNEHLYHSISSEIGKDQDLHSSDKAEDKVQINYLYQKRFLIISWTSILRCGLDRETVQP